MKHALLLAALLGVGCGPWAIVPGGRLFGEVVPGPVADWSFTDKFMTIAVETRPSFPWSVTTICFTHDGALYVPARDPEGKKWTHYVLENPSVRLKIGDKVYLGRAVRVIDADEQAAAIASLAKKYPQMGAARDPDAPLPHFWLFRIEPAA